MEVKIIEDNYSIALQTVIRHESTKKEDLRNALIKLGSKVGIDLVSDNMLMEAKVNTPMQQSFQGYLFSKKQNILYSTKDDYEFFARGILSEVPNTLQGYFDFQGVRGKDALVQPIRAVSHPPIKPGTIIDTAIIAKAVLATGCTAISLAKNILSKYYPKNLIIVSAFYSQEGIQELVSEIPTIKSIYIVGGPDSLNEDGMLIPGVGNLDDRLSSSDLS